MRGVSWWAAPEKIQLTLQAFVIELTKASLGGCLLIWILPEIDFFKIKIARRKKRLLPQKTTPIDLKNQTHKAAIILGDLQLFMTLFLPSFFLAAFQKKWGTFLPLFYFLYLNWIKIAVVPMEILPLTSTGWVLGLFFYNSVSALLLSILSFVSTSCPFSTFLSFSSPIIVLYGYFIWLFFLHMCLMC